LKESEMQTNWTTEDAQAITALVDAARQAIETYEWIIGDHPKLDPDRELPAELKRLREAISAVRRRGFTL
jgi:hypothetical protein